MKPKTKIQILVTKLSKKIRPISEAQKNFSYEKCLEKCAIRSRKTLYCLECGHYWKEGSILSTNLLGCDCPNCKNHLKLIDKSFKNSSYYSILTTVEGFQVVRMFFVCKNMKKKHTAECFAREAMQHWIDENGKVTTMSLSIFGSSCYYDSWIFSSKLEVRPNNFRNCPRYNIEPYVIYPKRKILPVIIRNGFINEFHDFAPHQLFSFILQDSYAETLLKTDQIKLLEFYYKHTDIIKYWNSIKICIRNNYKIQDVSLWRDYLDLLKEFNKDLFNPKYVCPKDLEHAHDHYLKKKQANDKKIELQKLRSKMDEDQNLYEEEKRRFFNLCFSDNFIVVQPLKTIEEFYNEGYDLKHCIFTNQYYKRKESLIMSARINNKPVETIEISLKNLEVSQSRGLNNQPTKFHSQILNLVNSNLHQIRKIKHLKLTA